MSEENNKREDEDQPRGESKKEQTGQGSASTAKPAQAKDDVQAYGEPSDGSGGTLRSQNAPMTQPSEPASASTVDGEPSDGSGGTSRGT
jgi:hypothetical protein